MKKGIIVFCFSLFWLHLSSQQLSHQQYREDFDYFWTTIKTDYCYWDKKQTDWAKVKSIFSPLADTVTSKGSFILLLEKVLYELYDHHASLSANTRESQRLVPTGTDIWAAYINGIPIITEIRLGFGADKAGMTEGMQIIAFNDVEIETAIQSFLAKTLKKEDVESKNYALRLLLAGKHSEIRKITVKYKNKQLEFFPDQPVNLLKEYKYDGEIESKTLHGNIGYIRINNRLGDNNLIPLFDSVVTSLKTTKALILDLRETPGGGNTTVARSILGRFITKEEFYQKHEFTAEEKGYGVKRSWVEIVSPRKTAYTKPLILLVNHWTGSVGEGITIGFDALKRVTIIGTDMARLNGAVYSYTMPHTGIRFSFPVEKLYHVNGTPRENFHPTIQPDLLTQKGQDPILNKAIDFIKNHK
ncbi:MAG: S41 family peptidase [Bacteroidota bacterium]|nr:S41 family peptidase [Bacteroidota bacterium]